MEKEFEIELQEVNTEDTTGTQLPLNFLLFGEIENDDVKVYIKQDVYKALEKLAVSDTSKELGSIIFGQYCQEYGKTHVIISNYVEAKYTDASASTLTFTHETWDFVHTEHEQRFKDLKIVGWQHTHPNYGIFLSNYDVFIQENFFNLPFQVAYVIDPIQNLRGFFQWKNGRIEKLKGYYIYDEVGTPIKIEQTKVNVDKSNELKTSKSYRAILGVLCLIVVALSCFVISMNSKYEKLLDEQIKNQAELLEQRDELADQKNMIEQQVMELGKYKDAIHEQAAIIENLKNELSEEKDTNTVKFQAYTVEAGDNLTKICREHGLEYSEYFRIILAVNGIENANEIYVGQKILLPIAQ